MMLPAAKAGEDKAPNELHWTEPMLQNLIYEYLFEFKSTFAFTSILHPSFVFAFGMF